jgi:glutamate/tyrosine decarboxylase-like PLP-dependent enzyme
MTGGDRMQANDGHRAGQTRNEHDHALALGWLSALLGLAPSTTGNFTHDGESANLQGLACAQYRMLNGDAEGLVYCSEDTDPLLERVMHRLGFAAGSVRRLPCADGRLDAFALARRVRQDRLAGRAPFCVVANAGTASTGAVDNMVLLAQVCKAEGLWLHVDGSRGGCAAMTPRGSKLLRGLEQADSLALDLQQPLLQPHPLGCLLLRDRAALGETLRSRHAEASPIAQDVKALKLWALLTACGPDTFRHEIDRRMRLADLAETEVRARAGWQLASRSQLGVVTFRFKPAGATECDADQLQAALAVAARRKGLTLLDTAQVKGHLALRLCTTHPAVDEPDVRVTLQWLFRQASWGEPTPRQVPRAHHEDREAADTTV